MCHQPTRSISCKSLPISILHWLMSFNRRQASTNYSILTNHCIINTYASLFNVLKTHMFPSLRDEDNYNCLSNDRVFYSFTLYHVYTCFRTSRSPFSALFTRNCVLSGGTKRCDELTLCYMEVIKIIYRHIFQDKSTKLWIK